MLKIPSGPIFLVRGLNSRFRCQHVFDYVSEELSFNFIKGVSWICFTVSGVRYQ